MMKIVTFKIDEDTLEKVDFYCFRRGIPRSEFIRQAIKEKLTHGKKGRQRIRVKRVVL